MIIRIEAPAIQDILAADECLVPTVEDLLLDALIEYRDTPRRIYQSSEQLTTRKDNQITITISPDTPHFIKNGKNGNGKEPPKS